MYPFIKQRSPYAEEWAVAIQDNLWIGDPSFERHPMDDFDGYEWHAHGRIGPDDFYMIPTIEEAAEIMDGGWTRGTCFWIQGYPEIGFANQVNGGGEWAVMRRGIRFESLSGWHFARTIQGPDGEEQAFFLREFLGRVDAASDEQLRVCNY